MEDNDPQTEWEERWANPGKLSWRITEIPRELHEACSGWFPPGSEVLDIGCGSGECAAWLAQRGFRVLGIDFASGAIAQARASHGESPQLQFSVLDICRTSLERRFPVLFDRGCLHIIPACDRPVYVRQIAATAAPGGHFLLIHKTMGAFFEEPPSYQQTADLIRREFEAAFDLIDIQEIQIPLATGAQPEASVPGLAIRMIRKASADVLPDAARSRPVSVSTIRPGSDPVRAGLGAPGTALPQDGIPWRWPQDIESSIPARFEALVAHQPDAPAIIDSRTTLSYAGLNEVANRLAHAVLGGSIMPVEAIGYLFGHGASQIVAMLGILKAGGFCVPIDLALPEALNREILTDAQVGMIVTDDEHRILAEALAPSGCRIVNLDHLQPDLPATNPGLSIGSDRLAHLHFTSGSTGKPKGVMQNHRNTLHFMATTGVIWPIQPGDRVIHLVSCSFSAVVLPVFGALLNGAAVVPCDPRQAGIAGLYEKLRDTRITTCFSVPTLYRRLVELMEETGATLPDLEMVVLGGEPLTPSDVEAFRRVFGSECRLLNLYAGAEMYNVCQNFLEQDSELAGPTVPAGYSIHGKELLIVDESGSPVLPGEAGEIAVRSRYLAPGYLNDPESTGATFLADPEGGDRRIYRTGDLGRLDANGCLVHLGRQNAMVKLRGQRVEPGAIEAALRAYPGVIDAAVTLRESAGGQKVLVSYVVRQPAAGLTARSLRMSLRERLPEVMVPQFVVFMEAFPVTSSGKLDRQALPPPGKARPDSGTPYIAPRTEVEMKIADVWAELLGLDEVGVEDNFFELGGDSILAMRMAVVVEKALASRVPDAFLRGTPTIANLVHLLSGGAGEAPAAMQAAVPPRTEQKKQPQRRWTVRSWAGARLRRFMVVGPAHPGRAFLPYAAGIRIQRVLIAQPVVQRMFTRELDTLRQWQEELGLPHDERTRRINLLANTWRYWWRAALMHPGAQARGMTISGAGWIMFGHGWPRVAMVLAVPHVGTLLLPLEKMIQVSCRETALVVGDRAVRHRGDKATREIEETRIFAAQMWEAQQVLQRDGVVLIAGDGRRGGQTVDVPFRGRHLPFRIGAATLAVETDALLVPVFASFDIDGRVHVDVLEPLTSQATTKEERITDLTMQYGRLYAARWPSFYASMQWQFLADNLELPVL